MPNKQSLYKLQSKVTKIRDCCSHSQNRIFSLLENNNYNLQVKKEIKIYADMCVTLEALCTYTSRLCCHSNVSKHCSNELKMSCSNMKTQCLKLKKHLNKNHFKNINCDKMYSAC